MVEHDNSPRDYIKCRSELSSPSTDWEKSWQRSRLKGLGSEATSFLWKLLHCILPTEQRLVRILPNLKEECKYCPDKTADLTHCFFECCKTRNVGTWLLSLVNQYDTIATASGILKNLVYFWALYQLKFTIIQSIILCPLIYLKNINFFFLGSYSQ